MTIEGFFIELRLGRRKWLINLNVLKYLIIYTEIGKDLDILTSGPTAPTDT